MRCPVSPALTRGAKFCRAYGADLRGTCGIHSNPQQKSTDESCFNDSILAFWEEDVEAGALAGRGFEADGAAVVVDNFGDD